MASDYADFLKSKKQSNDLNGFKPLWLPDCLFDFQKLLTEWAIRKGRSAVFADCGLGKTLMQLVWAENVVRKENRPVLVLTPIAVSRQTIREGEKFGISCRSARDGTVKPGINVVNYERLHYFDPKDFAGVVCDESSAIKAFTSKRQKDVTEFVRGLRYRLLCTATAAPNDYIELGTSSEALGVMGRMDMLATFFKNDENSLHPIWWGSKWRMKRHAEASFWRWVCSWARAIRKPSDLGFSDGDFVLPKLELSQHVVDVPGRRYYGFRPPLARTLDDQRSERKATRQYRCEKVAELLSKRKPSIAWCHLNSEGDLLERIIPGAVQVSGNDPDESKEEKFAAFTDGQIKTLVTKPSIGGFGMNWQHCSEMTFFPSHSFEQFYQSVRRCWRFGQKKRVRVEVVTSPGERGVLRNMERKSKAAEAMFTQLVAQINDSLTVRSDYDGRTTVEVPAWALPNK